MSHTFYLPDLGEGLAEAEIVLWYVSEGSPVTEDEPLLSVETAKALVDVPSPVSGRLIKIHASAGEVIPVHSALAEFTVQEQPDTTPAPALTPRSTANSAPITTEKAKPSPSAEHTNIHDNATVVGKMETTQDISEDVFIIGTARPAQPELEPRSLNLALGPSRVPKSRSDETHPFGTGGPASAKQTRFSTQNASGQTLPMTTTPALVSEDIYDIEPIKGSRRAMVDAMTSSRENVCAVTIFDKVDISSWYGNQDITTALVLAVCEAAKEVPKLNSWLDASERKLYVHHHVNLGLAVDTPEGLFVPVLQQVNRIPSYQLRTVIDQVLEEVRSRRSPPERFKRATIAISNFGSIAGRYATPVVVPPMTAILGVGRCFDEPKLFQSKKGKLKISQHKMLPLSLSFDHRAATGGEGARFLASLMRALARTASH